jgi:hypothetical protein
MLSKARARWAAAWRGVLVAGFALGVAACGAEARSVKRAQSPRADASGASFSSAGVENGYAVDGLNVSQTAIPSAAPPAVSRGSGSYKVAAAPPAPPPSFPVARAPSAPPSVADVPHSAAMLIYTAALSMAVFQVTEATDAVERVGRECGGYLASRGDNAITIRVPRDRFDDAIGRIERLGDVVHRDIKAQDVTDQFVDLQARLKNAYSMRDQLLELLRKANVKEALEIEASLGRVTEQIEVMEGKLKLLRDQIAFSTITVQFAPVAQQDVRDTSLLAPFPWLQDLGLQRLLQVSP